MTFLVYGLLLLEIHYIKMYRIIHIGYEPFDCPICNFSFTQSCVLKNHIWIHIKQNAVSFKHKYIYSKSKLQETYKRHTHNCKNTSERNVTKLYGLVGTSNSIFVRFTQEMNLLTAFNLLAIPFWLYFSQFAILK